MPLISESITHAAQVLEAAGVPEPRREAGSLLAHVLGKNRTFLITNPADSVTGDQFERFLSVVQRRAAGEPLQYITGVQDFFGREFRVTPDVLIPRPETELLVEAALSLIHQTEKPRICDVGTGSGCIAISILCERPEAQATAIDISQAALELAKKNAEALGVNERVEFVLSDCFDEVDPATRQFDLIASNPPYVSADQLSGLQREVRDHEPQIALSPGGDGLGVIRRILNQAPNYLIEGGYLVFEIGFDQGEQIEKVVRAPWVLVEILPDLQSIPRIVVLRKTF